jgi:hypothetical protein
MILSKQEIDKIFQENDHQADVLLTLFKRVFPDWEKIKMLDGYPLAGKEVHQYITESFVRFDKKHHPKVLNGGLWMNKGFSVVGNEELGNWEVQRCRVIYK